VVSPGAKRRTGQTIKLAMNGILALQVGAMAGGTCSREKGGTRRGATDRGHAISMARSGVLDVKGAMMAQGE